METRRRFVQNVNGLACGFLLELGSKFHPLGLAAGKLGGRLTEFDITKTNVLQSFYFPVDLRPVLKEFASFLYAHFKDIMDVFAFIQAT